MVNDEARVYASVRDDREIHTPDALAWPGRDERVQRYGKAVWEASRADEGTISATGANIVARAVMAVADAELALYKRGGKTLGEIVDWQCRAVLDATGLHHLIDEDGDGDWGLVWEYLAELRPRLEAAEAKVARVEAVVNDEFGFTYDAIRAALDGPA